VANKVGDRLSEVQREWLAHSPLAFVATADALGRVDVSPKGDPPGFAHVLDDRTIVLPERPGNKRMDGYLNILQRPYVGTLFLIPGRGDTLRINGRARIVAEADYFDQMKPGGQRPGIPPRCRAWRSLPGRANRLDGCAVGGAV
jgi:predicted pyridoxine 5'-phosphate oxidase superfamily flavin-nucleotide-binding protein